MTMSQQADSDNSIDRFYYILDIVCKLQFRGANNMDTKLIEF